MQRPAALAASLLLLGALARADDSPPARAQALLDRDDPRGAVTILEDALGSAKPAARPEIVEALRRGYDKAARKAEAEGLARESEGYRENLKLLNRKAKPPKAAEPAPPAVEETPRVVEPPIPEAKPAEPAPLAPPKDEITPQPAPNVDEEKTTPAPSDLARADRAWKEKRYLDAGAIYGEMAREGRLPAARNDHWAYCRLVNVLEVINVGPKTPAQWAQVHAEIDRIRVLSPKNWYGEYLRSVAVERSNTARRPASNKTILRGASPEEKAPAPARRPKAAKAPGAMKPAEPAPETSPPLTAGNEAAVGKPGPAWGSWQTFDTPNFRIFHRDEALARRAAGRAEASRAKFAAEWSGARPRSPWSPRCDLYLYPEAAQFAEETKQSPESPGFSTSELSGGRVTQRVIRLRADHPKMLDAVLPHEVTHVILADLFPIRQIPRWADEGMAVLSEPRDDQTLRDADLATPLAENRAFDMATLMTTDYPDEPLRAMFYAQSISVTRYLVGLGTPAQFVGFVRDAQDRGIEPALKKSYNIRGFADLDRRWRDYARDGGGRTASTSTDTVRK